MLRDVRVSLIKLDHPRVLRGLLVWKSPQGKPDSSQNLPTVPIQPSEIGGSDDPIYQKKCKGTRTVTGNSSNLLAGVRDLEPGKHIGDCQKMTQNETQANGSLHKVFYKRSGLWCTAGSSPF